MQQWREAEEAQPYSMLKNKMYEMVNAKSPQKKLIPYWVYKRKRDNAGHVQRLKARLVAKGLYQIYGQDYTDTYGQPCSKTNLDENTICTVCNVES